MILHYLKKKENKDQELIDFIYVEIIKSANIIINKDLRFKKTDFNITFEVVSMLLFCFFISQNEKFDKNRKIFNQGLMNLFIKDIDHSLRLTGLDMNLGKYVKKYVKKFYYRLSKFKEIIKEKDKKNFINYLSSYNLIDSNKNIDDITKELIFFDRLQELSKMSQNIENNRFLFKKIFN